MKLKPINLFKIEKYQFKLLVSQAFAKEHVEKWITAWNNHDLKTLLSMYSEDIQFSSPKIRAVLPGRNSSKLNNKKELEEYWSLALKEKYSNLRFESKDLIVHNNIIILEYYASLNTVDRTLVIEKFEFENNKIIKSSVFYGADELP